MDRGTGVVGMKFKFEANLPHQQKAVEAVADLFEDATIQYGNLTDYPRIAPEEWEGIHSKARQIAEENAIPEYKFSKTDENDFTIEMETGTGKTYAYIKTIFELHKKHKLQKFIIVVPNIAVREGVLKHLDITKSHFRDIYNTQADVIGYDSKKIPGNVRTFCSYSVGGPLIMVLNMQAFNKDLNILNDPNRDKGYLIKDLAKTRPIIILDEPQKGMDSENMKERLKNFNALFKLRYSATHKENKNLIYRLGPYEASEQRLVKRLIVTGMAKAASDNYPYIKVLDFEFSNDAPRAKLEIRKKLSSGEFKTITAQVKKGDKLFKKSWDNIVYRGYEVEKISTEYDDEDLRKDAKITFTNGKRLVYGESLGTTEDTKIILETQIREAIKNHFSRKKQLKPKGIKNLCLFFIDRVANYVDGGIISKIFEREYKKYIKEKNIISPGVKKVHNGYFAKTKKGKGEYTDSEASMKNNKEIYDLILKDKEKLLSFDEPLEFIFSHSALGIGWDNPNIFTICTLNETKSELKKHQEIGRGLRICVNQQGDRQPDKEEPVKEIQEINSLMVISNRSYDSFLKGYQEVLEKEYRITTSDERDRKLVRSAKEPPKKLTLNKEKLEGDYFKELWAKMGQKTIFYTYFDEQELIKESVKSLNQIKTPAEKIEIKTARVEHHEGGVRKGNLRQDSEEEFASSYQDIDVVGMLADEANLSRNTSYEIFNRLDDEAYKHLIKNPRHFIIQARERIKEVMKRKLVCITGYRKIDESYPISNFEPEVETRNRRIAPTPDKGLYDNVACDSEVEMNMVKILNEDIHLRTMLKLPGWYKIDTPIGSYTPDFAIVIEKMPEDDGRPPNPRYYIVVETKGASDSSGLRGDEKMKIAFALKHFKEIGMGRKENSAFLAPVKDMDRLKGKFHEEFGKEYPGDR